MKKGAVIGIGAAVLLVVAVIIVLMAGKKDGDSGSLLVGTWYSDRPDSLIFTEEGNYQGSEWNGLNPWLLSGTYTIEGDTLTLNGPLDGVTTLTIGESDSGEIILVGRYTYYRTEEEALAAIKAVEEQAAEDEENFIPNTIELLKGEWVSLDGYTECTYTDTSFTIHFKGSEAVEEETLYYEYEILDEYKMAVVENGVTQYYNYTLTEEDGVWYLGSPIKAYASVYIKKDTQESQNTNAESAAADGEIKGITDDTDKEIVEGIKELLDQYKKDIVGTWQGDFEQWTEDGTIRWTYVFTGDGTYTLSRGTDNNTELLETGTYSLSADVSQFNPFRITFVSDGGTQEVEIWFSNSEPVSMNIEKEETEPAYYKQ